MEQMKRLKRKRRGVERAERDTKEKESSGLHSAPHPPIKYTECLVGRTEPRVKGERKGLFCAFHPSGAQRRTHTHMHPVTYTQAYTHGHAYTNTCMGLKVALTSFSVLGQPENGAHPRRVSQRRGASVENWLVASRFAHAHTEPAARLLL